MYNFVTGEAVDRELLSSRTDNKLFKCKLSCCQSCSYCPRALAKERVKSRGSRLLSNTREIKICQRCFLCHSITLCKTCNKCPKCCHKSACRGQTAKLLENLAGSGCRSESSSNPERGLYSPLSDPVKTHKVSYCHKLLCKSPQEQLPVGGITSAYRQECNRTSKKQNLSELFQPTIFSPQAKQKMETYSRSEQSEFFPQGGEIQDGDTGNHQDIPPARGVVIDFRDAYFHIPIQEQSRKYLRFHVQSQTYQFKALPFGLSTAPLEFTVIAKEVKLMASHRGIRIHQYLDDWLVRATSHQACLQHTQSLVKICQKSGWLVNLEKSELVPKQVFDFVGYQFDLRAGRVRLTPDRWQNLQEKILEIMSLPHCPV